jgi:hypothetical protein
MNRRLALGLGFGAALAAATLAVADPAKDTDDLISHILKDDGPARPVLPAATPAPEPVVMSTKTAPASSWKCPTRSRCGSSRSPTRTVS